MPHRITDELKKKCRNISEALPYIRDFAGKIFVIKYGGSAMVDETLRQNIITDLVLMKYVGLRPVLVHGGGKEISQMMDKLNKKSEFFDGIRVTDKETLDIVEMVLVGKVNKALVGLINRQGGRAVGISGKDDNLISAVRHEPVFKHLPDGVKKIDLGYVGRIQNINADIIVTLQESGYMPVIAPTSICDDGSSLNVNADLAAGKIAAALKASKLIFLTDQRGICREEDSEGTVISELPVSQINSEIENGVIHGGMLPKVEASITAVKSGVENVHIIDGRIEHSLLLEIFTDKGIGTMIK